MSYKLDSARCQAAEEYAKRWKPNEYAELADAKTILLFLFEQARMQLPDAMTLRPLLEQKEMDKHAFAKIVTWITVIVMTHKKDVAMRAWLLEQAKNVGDGIATLCFSLASECK